MTIIDKHTEWVILPKINRCYQNDCNVYQLILQKCSNNEIFVFIVRDFSLKNDPRYRFKFAVPDCMGIGEYNLFLVTNSEWNSYELDQYFVKNSYRQTDKEAITFCDNYIVIDGKVLMTSKKHVPFTQLNDITGNQCAFYTTIHESNDPRSEGELFEEIQVIYCGLLKLQYDELSNNINFVELNSNIDTKYIEYGG